MPYSLTRNFPFGKIKQNHSKLNKTERNGKGEKQKMKKKILAALTAGILTTGLMTGTVFAADTEVKGDENLKGEVYAFIAASLSNSMEEIQKDFNELYPNVTIYYSADSSGTLQTQIEEGAPVDLFFSAAESNMDALEEQGLIDAATRKDVLQNEIVLIAPQGETAVTSFETILDSEPQIALGEAESVPAGKYAQEIFTNLGIWDEVKSHAVFASNVREVLAWVEAGEADCGVVYATDAKTSDAVQVVSSAPADGPQVLYPAAIIKDCANPEGAQAFLDFLTSEEAGEVFASYGFTFLAE